MIKYCSTPVADAMLGNSRDLKAEDLCYSPRLKGKAASQKKNSTNASSRMANRENVKLLVERGFPLESLCNGIHVTS
jgi:hypothetical protein